MRTDSLNAGVFGRPCFRAAMLDLQNLASWEREPNAHPVGRTFYFPQSSSAFNIKDGDYCAEPK